MEINETETLQLIYDLVATTMQSHDLDYLLSRYMLRVNDILGAEASLVRVVQSGALVLVDSTGLKPDSEFVKSRISIKEFMKNTSFDQNTLSIRTGHFDRDIASSRVSGQTLASILFRFKSAVQGCYQFFIPTSEPLGENTLLLLDNVSKHIGYLVQQDRMDDDSARLLLIEERGRMANEMHDSLAQTLASLRIQVRVLDETLQQDNEQLVSSELVKLENQVEQANRELRSLISRFRAPLQSHQVVDAVEKVIAEFHKQNDVIVFFQNEWEKDNLSHDRRTDVIRIVQEALMNVRKHANASNVRVLLRHRAGRYRIIVEDDGEGIAGKSGTPCLPGEHVGQEIMTERAANLGAELRIESESGEGTRVSLEFDENNVK